MTERFWQREKKRIAGTPDEQNLLLKQTYIDAKSIASDKHPKALYLECLKNSSFWHHYSASPDFSVDDMVMYVCKDIGCALNYCGLVKKSYPDLWEGSSDCMQEYQDFNKCMVAERRRYQWMDDAERPPIYEYAQKRIQDKRHEQKMYGLLSTDENAALQRAIKKEEETNLKQKKESMEL